MVLQWGWRLIWGRPSSRLADDCCGESVEHDIWPHATVTSDDRSFTVESDRSRDRHLRHALVSCQQPRMFWDVMQGGGPTVTLELPSLLFSSPRKTDTFVPSSARTGWSTSSKHFIYIDTLSAAHTWPGKWDQWNAAIALPCPTSSPRLFLRLLSVSIRWITISQALRIFSFAYSCSARSVWRHDVVPSQRHPTNKEQRRRLELRLYRPSNAAMRLHQRALRGTRASAPEFYNPSIVRVDPPQSHRCYSAPSKHYHWLDDEPTQPCQTRRHPDESAGPGACTFADRAQHYP